MIKVKKLHLDAKLPTRSYEYPLGYDLYYCPPKNQIRTVIVPHEIVKLKTGIAIEPPEGYGYIIKERGGLGSQGLAVRAGVIDEDWRGEVIVCMQNLGSVSKWFAYGDKIAQIIFIPTPKWKIVEVNQLSNTVRGKKGFGSSD